MYLRGHSTDFCVKDHNSRGYHATIFKELTILDLKYYE